MAQIHNKLGGKYRPKIMLQDDYRNYFTSVLKLKELAKAYNVSYGRLSIVLTEIHFSFMHFINIPEYKYLHFFLERTIYQTKKKLVEQPEKLAAYIQAFDVFAAKSIVEADELIK
jgi:hypothetical protein